MNNLNTFFFFYRTHAAEKGIGIRDLFKRRKSLGDEKENLLPKEVDEDLHDM